MSTGIISVDVEARLDKLQAGLSQAEQRVGQSANTMAEHGKTFADKFSHHLERGFLRGVLGFHAIVGSIDLVSAAIEAFRGNTEAAFKSIERIPVFGHVVGAINGIVSALSGVGDEIEKNKKKMEEWKVETEKEAKAFEFLLSLRESNERGTTVARKAIALSQVDTESGKKEVEMGFAIDAVYNKRNESTSKVYQSDLSDNLKTEALANIKEAFEWELGAARGMAREVAKLKEKEKEEKIKKVKEERKEIIHERESIFDAVVAFDKEEFDAHQKNMADLIQIDTDTGVKRLELMGKTLDAELFKIGRAMDERRMLSKTSAEAEALDQLEVVEKQLAIRTAKEKEFHEAQKKKEKDFGILEEFVKMADEKHPRNSGSEVVLSRTAAFGGTQDRIKSPLELKAEQQLVMLKAIEANTRRKEVINILGGDR